MNLWVVYNGFRGNGAVAVLVAAEDEPGALELAEAAFRAEPDARDHGDAYWTNLEAHRVPLPAVGEVDIAHWTKLDPDDGIREPF
jgi:hypothetical protein